MKFTYLSALAAVAASSFTAATPAAKLAAAEESLDKRQLQVPGYKYCSSSTGICYTSYETAGKSTYRFAVPQEAAGTNFDIAFQLVAPRQTGWIGIGWGGSMLDNPLTVAWQNGGTVQVSSRWATNRNMPAPYSGATYRVLSDTNVNATHWTLSAICTGCSSWTSRVSGSAKWLNPASRGIDVSWAQNPYTGTVANPSNPDSNFDYHDYIGAFYADLAGSPVAPATFSTAATMLQPADAASRPVPAAAVAPGSPAVAQPQQPANPFFPGWPFGGFGKKK